MNDPSRCYKCEYEDNCLTKGLDDNPTMYCVDFKHKEKGRTKNNLKQYEHLVPPKKAKEHYAKEPTEWDNWDMIQDLSRYKCLEKIKEHEVSEKDMGKIFDNAYKKHKDQFPTLNPKTLTLKQCVTKALKDEFIILKRKKCQ